MDTTKFDTCRYRTDEEIEFGTISCCGQNIAKGYCCIERGIDGLTPPVCVNCEFYEPRIIIEEE